jgi:O-antigen ligase
VAFGLTRKNMVSSPVKKPSRPDRFAAGLAFAAIICASMLVGGARDDLISLLIWRPLSMLLLTLAIALCWSKAWARGRALLVFALCVIALVGLHLIPLPPQLWTLLPGRALLADIFASAGIAQPWQPLSLAQARTWNALFSLAGPLAVLILTLALDRERHRQMLLLIVGLGFLSGVIGIWQALGPANGPLYFYRITNSGTSVGLFANRNHQAIFLTLLFPLLAANLALFKGRAEKLYAQRAISLAAAGFLVPLILLTGSRAGVVLTPIALMLSWWVYRPPLLPGKAVVANKARTRVIIAATVSIVAIGVLIVALRTPAVKRLVDSDPADDLRVQGLPAIFDAIREFGPFGSGIGTFVETYQIFERDALITNSYFNHAHNDYLELLVTGGWLAVALLFWAIALGGAAFIKLARNRGRMAGEPGSDVQAIGRAGFSVLVLLALGSATDYPLRVPSLMICAMVAAAWCSNAYRNSQKS